MYAPIIVSCVSPQAQKYEQENGKQYYHMDPAASAAEWTIETSDDDLSATLFKRQPTEEPALYTNTYWHYLSNTDSGSPAAFGRNDKPFISFKIVSFPKVKKTLFSLTWSHVLADMVSMFTIMKQLTRIISGDSEDIPELHLDNPLEKAPETDPAIAQYLPGLFRIPSEGKEATMKAWRQTDGTFTRPLDLYLPASLLAKLKADCKVALEEENGGRVSGGDVLMAWYIKFIAALLPPEEKEMAALQMINLRTRSPHLFHPDETRLANAVHLCQIPFKDTVESQVTPKVEIEAMPLHHLARQVRKSLATSHPHTDIDPILASLMYGIKNDDTTFGPTKPCANLHASNMLGFRFRDLSFSGALKEPGSATGKVEGLYEWSPNPERARALFRLHPLWKNDDGGIWCKLELPRRFLEHEKIKSLIVA